MITEGQAQELAITYHAYMKAIHADYALGIVVWGPALIEAQEKTGVAMLDADLIRENIGFARLARGRQRQSA